MFFFFFCPLPLVCILYKSTGRMEEGSAKLVNAHYMSWPKVTIVMSTTLFPLNRTVLFEGWSAATAKALASSYSLLAALWHRPDPLPSHNNHNEAHGQGSCSPTTPSVRCLCNWHDGQLVLCCCKSCHLQIRWDGWAWQSEMTPKLAITNHLSLGVWYTLALFEQIRICTQW